MVIYAANFGTLFKTSTAGETVVSPIVEVQKPSNARWEVIRWEEVGRLVAGNAKLTSRSTLYS